MSKKRRFESASMFDFEELVQREEARLEGDSPVELEVTIPGMARLLEGVAVPPAANDEPWVKFTNRDRFGLALSGGGIRSASFNLGLLQGLAETGILQHVHYLSTVSGGGYVGGFLSAELSRSPRPEEGQAKRLASILLPSPAAIAPAEAAPVRRLREFGNFLVPRSGLFSSDTWTAVANLLGGMVASLLASTVLLMLVGCSGFLLSQLVVGPTCASAVINAVALTTLTQFLWLVPWGAGASVLPPSKTGDSGSESTKRRSQWTARGILVLVFALDFAMSVAFLWLLKATHLKDWPTQAFVLGESVSGLEPAAAFALVALGMYLLRALFSRAPMRDLAVFERAAANKLIVAIIWLVWVGLWTAGRAYRMDGAAVGAGLGGAASGGLFFMVRQWLFQKPEETRASGLIARVWSYLKPLTPQLLAIVAVTLMIAGAMALTQEALLYSQWPFAPACLPGRALAIGATALILLLIFACAFDPAKLGLHSFYRERIRNAFLQGLASDETPDPTLESLNQRPIHLVCCTANDIQGDQLQTLGRGGRSAVLSPLGLAIGGFAAPPGPITLSSALTASAAAVNSQMASVSMQFGPAVAFLVTALNLRLGLWVPHPLRKPSLFPPFASLLWEGLNLTKCPTYTEAKSKEIVEALEQNRSFAGAAGHVPRIHLSDGGHFENLALYELVRRHCRYIVVSDAAADPDSAFDDLGNAVRRIREDFGVEVELDVGPLRPTAGISQRNVVVGTIHYDGLRGSDKGTLVYFRPTLTGSEPVDVQQYSARNATFPQQGTIDQFFDEEQWESYRRLGQHSARSAFRTRTDKDKAANPLDAIFLAMREAWQPGPHLDDALLLELSQRSSALESDLGSSGLARLRREVFPEVAIALPSAVAPANEPDDEMGIVISLLQVMQLMEDVWRAAKLDEAWSHAVNQGWMSYFHRWTSAPSFRRWWPLLRATHSRGFQDFVQKHFKIFTNSGDGRPTEIGRTGAQLSVSEERNGDGLAARLFDLRHRTAAPGEKELNCYITLDPSTQPIHVATLRYVEEERAITWALDDFFVPPQFNGAGISARFLDAIVAKFKQTEKTLTVRLTDDVVTPGDRSVRTHDVAFFTSRGFKLTADRSTLVRQAV